MLDLIIIGGGAAGLAAACAAARPGRRVVLLEKQSRVGRKLLATGNGRCNLTRLGAKPSDYFGARGAAATALRLCPPEDVLAFFDELGLPAAPDEEGRVYPLSNQAASVLDALRLSAAERGCEIRTDCAAEEIRAEGNFLARSARSDAQSRGQKASGRSAEPYPSFRADAVAARHADGASIYDERGRDKPCSSGRNRMPGHCGTNSPHPIDAAQSHRAGGVHGKGASPSALASSEHERGSADAASSFLVRTSDGQTLRARRVLICTGGLAAPKLGACGDGYKLMEMLGHSSTPKFPAIAALKTPPEPVRPLKGQRAECLLTLTGGSRTLRAERGEALFADGGVSGIAAMQLARACQTALRAGEKCALHLNFAPDWEDADARLSERARRLPLRMMEDFLSGVVPKRIGQTLVKAAGIEPLSREARSLSPRELRALAAALTDWTLPVTGTQGFEQAQVTAGGVSMDGFDPETMQSRRVPGLYGAGELMDVDGDCGGFNLQWAWSSALIAARHIQGQWEEEQ